MSGSFSVTKTTASASTSWAKPWHVLLKLSSRHRNRSSFYWYMSYSWSPASVPQGGNVDVSREDRDVKMNVKYLSWPNHGGHTNQGQEERRSIEEQMITSRGNNLVLCVQTSRWCSGWYMEIMIPWSIWCWWLQVFALLRRENTFQKRWRSRVQSRKEARRFDWTKPLRLSLQSWVEYVVQSMKLFAFYVALLLLPEVISSQP